MAGKIIINTERCNGCGLCAEFCPKNCIEISKKSNKKGYFPARLANNGCTACAVCAIMCPETVIEVYREKDIIAVAGSKKNKQALTKEKV